MFAVNEADCQEQTDSDQFFLCEYPMGEMGVYTIGTDVGIVSGSVVDVF